MKSILKLACNSRVTSLFLPFEKLIRISCILANKGGSEFEGPNISVTERRGRKRGLRATLIHVNSGQIIYHLVQTNGVLDCLSERGGGEVEEGGV